MKTIQIPAEPSDEALRVILACKYPATYREYLRHPLSGPESKKQEEREIALAKKEYLAIVKLYTTEK